MTDQELQQLIASNSQAIADLGQNGTWITKI
jgi:hypothetical protein